MVETNHFERLAARVRGSARDGGLIETAQVKLVGLDEVRRAAGARWPRMREHVREGSLKIISARIGPDDTVIPCGDGFLVVFADVANAETEHRCRDIRDALITFYLGEDALRVLRAEVDPETISAAHLANIVSATPEPLPRARGSLSLGRFWPVWAARHQKVSAFLCAPILDADQPLPRMGYTPDFREKAAHQVADYLDLDLCLLEQAFDAAEHGERPPIGVSVHATTLQSRKARTFYLKHLAANASCAKSRMFVSIAEIPPGTPLMALTEWVSGLKHTFARVNLDLHHHDRALNAIASTGAWAAGFQVGPCKSAQGGQLRIALNEVDTWCRVLRRQGVQPFMQGFAEPGFFDLASFSEIAFATGQGLWPCQTSPAMAPAAVELAGATA